MSNAISGVHQLPASVGLVYYIWMMGSSLVGLGLMLLQLLICHGCYLSAALYVSSVEWSFALAVCCILSVQNAEEFLKLSLLLI